MDFRTLTSKMDKGFTREEILISQLASSKLTRIMEKPNHETETTKVNERTEEKEKDKMWKAILIKQQEEIGKLINKMLWVEEESLKRAAKIDEQDKKFEKLLEITNFLYLAVTEGISSPEIEKPGDTETEQKEIESEATEETNTEGKKEGGFGSKGEGAEAERKAVKNQEKGSGLSGNGREQMEGEWIDESGTRPKHVTRKEIEREENRKRNLILMGHREEFNKMKDDRKGREREYIEKLIKEMLGKEGNKIEYNAHRLGLFSGETKRPIKMTFRDIETVDKILKNGYKIKQLKGNEKLTLRRDLTQKERTELNEKLKEARDMNNQRSDTEKEQFFYKVVEGNIVKRYLQNPKRRKKQRDQRETKFST